jgi:transposase
VRSINKVLRELLDITRVLVKDVKNEERRITVHVTPAWRDPRCSICKRKGPGYDRLPVRCWRHLWCGDCEIRLAYAPRRVNCAECGVHAELVPWGDARSRFTYVFEETTAYFAQVTDQSQVSRLMGIAWTTVGRIIERVIERHRDPNVLDGVKRIGVDEFSYRKRHRYITIVVDHDRRCAIWAQKGRSADVLGEFFKELGPDRVASLTHVTMDMCAAYISAVKLNAPGATITFDRFHVQKLASDAVDKVRRSIVRTIEDKDEARAVKGSRWSLLKNPWDLSRPEKAKLSEIQRTNLPLYRAYLLKESLAATLDRRQPNRARKAIEDWMSWASRVKLEPFLRVSRTIREHLEGIMAYIKSRLTNGFAEGINNKLRMIARRAFGFHSAESLIAMLFLTCGGVQLHPRLPRIDPHER